MKFFKTILNGSSFHLSYVIPVKARIQQIKSSYRDLIAVSTISIRLDPVVKPRDDDGEIKKTPIFNLNGYVFILFCLWIIISPLRAEIIHADTMVQVEERVNVLLKTIHAKDILVAFDVDDTLVRSSSAKTPKLTETITPTIIKNLQQKGVVTIAFTAAKSGKNSKGMSREIIRYLMLKSLEIEFFQGIQNFQSVYVEREEDSENEAIERDLVVFYRGILFSNAKNSDPNKGDAIVYFFQIRNLHPKVFIMVDDRRDQLEHIEETLKETYPHIQFIGIEYEQPESAFKKFKRKYRKALKWIFGFLSSPA